MSRDDHYDLMGRAPNGGFGRAAWLAAQGGAGGARAAEEDRRTGMKWKDLKALMAGWQIPDDAVVGSIQVPENHDEKQLGYTLTTKHYGSGATVHGVRVHCPERARSSD